MVQFSILKTDLGSFGILVNESDLLKVILPNKINSISIEITNPGSYKPIMHNVIEQLNQYFLGIRKQFDISLKLEMPPFYKKVLKEVSEIPYGQTFSYKNIARKLKNPRAYRAVANANAANPIPIIIPCHRVIQSNGDLGNYGGGRQLKQSLVQIEKDNLLV